MTNTIINQYSTPELMNFGKDKIAPFQKIKNVGVEFASLIFQTLKVWDRRDRERRNLAAMDLRMLRDAGLHPSEASREANKPFWVK